MKSTSKPLDVFPFAEIGFLGKAPGAYMMLLGGGAFGQRLAKVYRGKYNIYIVYYLCDSEE